MCQSELVNLIGSIVGFKGKIVFGSPKPDGTPRKLLNVSRLSAAGWKTAIGLEEGISSTYKQYRDQQHTQPKLTLS